MDIDIDVAPGTSLQDLLPGCVNASMVNKGVLKKHPVGVYVQNMPVDRETGLAAIPYDKASQFGFFKFDFLNLHLLSHYSSKEQVREAARREPDWNLLLREEITEKLFHMQKHYEVIVALKPQSIEDLADCLALIRPGKRHLLDLYLQDKKKAQRQLWQRDSKGYTYKRCQAIAYAHNVVLHLHVLASAERHDSELEW